MGRYPSVNKNLPPHMRARRRGAKVWYYYDHGGKPRCETPLGADYVTACQRWAELERGTARATPAQPTFKDAADRYQQDVLPAKAPKTRREYLAAIDRLLAHFNDPPAPLDAIRPKHWAEYAATRPRIAATRDRAVFAVIWQHARQLGYTDASNPSAGWAGKKSERRYHLAPDVFDAIRAAADAPMADALDLAYLTGQRVADVLRMQRTDLRDGHLAIDQGKTGERLRMAVSGRLAELVARLIARADAGRVHSLALLTDEHGRAFTYGKLRYRFDKARDAAATARPLLAQAIRAAQFRDTRSAAGTTKAEREGLVAAQDQLGHRHASTTAIYVRRRVGRKATPTE